VEAAAPQTSEHGLKKDAIGFLDGLIIGIASTAPAYSLAAVLAIVVVGVGVQAPAVLLTSFVPMFLIASAFYYGVAPPGGVGEEWKENRAALEDQARAHTAEALAAAEQAGLTASVELVRERPAAALVPVADARDARFIVVGTWGESPLRGAILGSTPHKLLHLSGRPVVVVPAA
jgi:nucleotide-binding universal stress UspA family protein